MLEAIARTKTEENMMAQNSPIRPKKIIWMMYKLERLIYRLYSSFADNFPEYETFWREMAKDEKRHAELVKKLYQAELKGAVQFNHAGINEYTLETFILYINRIMKRVAQKKMSEDTAMALTMDIESSLIEKNVFKSFRVFGAEYKDIAARLDNDTWQHLQQARQMMAQSKDKFRYNQIYAAAGMGTGRLMPSYI